VLRCARDTPLRVLRRARDTRRAGARRRALGRGRVRCRATRLRSRAPFGATPLASFPLHDVKQRGFFVPAARLRVRVCLSLAPDPEPFVPTPTEGQAERREAHCLELVALVSARRHACEAWAVPRNRDARLSALHRGAVGPGTASVSGICRRMRCEGFTPPGKTCPAAAPGVSYPRLRAAVDATPRSAIRIVSGDAPR
jgi:hypothetical protein